MLWSFLMEGPYPARILGHRTGRAFGAFATFGALATFATFATVLTTEAAALEQVHALLTAELLAVDAACSRFRRGAELWRVNHARGRPVRVSPLLGEALLAIQPGSHTSTAATPAGNLAEAGRSQVCAET